MIKIIKDCFGKHMVENIECVMCEHDSSCSLMKRELERKSKMKFKPHECHKCNDIVKCNNEPQRCLGRYRRKCDFERCRCKVTCEDKSLKMIKVRCTQRIRCTNLAYTSETKLFEEGKTYSLNELDGMLCEYNSTFVILKEYDDFRESPIFRRYFKEIKDWEIK